MPNIYVNINVSGTVDIKDLAALMALVQPEAPMADSAVAVAEAKPKTARKAAEKVEPEAAAAVEDKGEDPVTEGIPTLADLQAAAPAYIKANTREAFAEKLAAVGAPNLSGVPEDKRAEFLASIKV